MVCIPLRVRCSLHVRIRNKHYKLRYVVYCFASHAATPTHLGVDGGRFPRCLGTTKFLGKMENIRIIAFLCFENALVSYIIAYSPFAVDFVL